MVLSLLALVLSYQHQQQSRQRTSTQLTHTIPPSPPTHHNRPLRSQLKWGVVGLVAVNFATSLYTSWKAWREFVTLPAACFIEIDLEQQQLVERASSNPLRLLAAGARELELQALVQVQCSARWVCAKVVCGSDSGRDTAVLWVLGVG